MLLEGAFEASILLQVFGATRQVLTKDVSVASHFGFMKQEGWTSLHTRLEV